MKWKWLIWSWGCCCWAWSWWAAGDPNPLSGSPGLPHGSGLPGMSEAAACPTAEACPECPTCPAPEAGTAGEITDACPFWLIVWLTARRRDAEAFIHWNEDDPKEVPAGCASATVRRATRPTWLYPEDLAFTLETGVPVGEVVSCNACHDAAALTLSTIPFPSGITLTVEGPTVRCMVCHQGRAAGSTVDAAIAKEAPADDDTVVNALGFTNIHYKAAAATLYGTVVKGGYEYADKAYDAKFAHEPGIDTCVDCHNQHTSNSRWNPASATISRPPRARGTSARPVH